MIELSTANLGIYVVQILIVVSLAAAAARVLNVPDPGVRLAYWRLVVLLCLALPLLVFAQPAPTSDSTPGLIQPSALAGGVVDVSRTAFESESSAPIGAYVLTVLLAGIWLRGVWLAMGLARLRRVRREAEPIVLEDDVERLRLEIAPLTEIRASGHSRQPATFGFRRPVILLPHTVASMSHAERVAIVCHELIHVRRRDWIWTIAEELLGTVFWFHPAMRYAITRVQASREEVVDAEVVARTGNKAEYIRALLAFAEEPRLLSATSFVQRNQFATRLRRLAEEVQMSRLRLRVTVPALAGVLVAGIVATAAGLRYDVKAQQPVSPPPAGAVQFTMPLSRAIVRMDRPVYPQEAWEAGIGAEVSMLVNVSANGSMTVLADPAWRVTVSSRSPEDAVQSFWARQGWRDFIEAVTGAVRQWQVVPAESDVTVAARVSFQPPSSPLVSRNLQGMSFYFERMSPETQVVFVRGLGERYRASDPATVVDLHFLVPVGGAQGVLRVGGTVREPQRVHGVPPVYPEAAKAAGVQGSVVLEVLLAVDGTVQDLRVLRSIPLLDQAALDAVRTWVFSATVVDGVPREVITNVTVDFTLPPQ